MIATMVAQLGLAFTVSSQRNWLNYRNNHKLTVSFFNRHDIISPYGGLCLLVSQQFQFYFISLPGCFSPFPHGTSSLSVDFDI